MKRNLFCLATLVLVMCTIFSSGVCEELSNEVVDQLPSWTIDMLTLGEELYVLTSDGLYRMVENGWLTMNKGIGDALDMDADASAIYCIERVENSEEVTYRVLAMSVLEDGQLNPPEVICTLDWDLNDQWADCHGLVIYDDIAYVLMSDISNWKNRTLYCVDLKDGQAEKLLSDSLTELVRYKDGLLLARRFNDDEFTQPDGTIMPPDIVSINPINCEIAKIGTMGHLYDGAIAYDPDTDDIYFCNSASVYRVTSKSPERVGALLPSNVSRESQNAVIFAGRYYIEDSTDDIISSSIDSAQIPTSSLLIEQPPYGIEMLIREFAKMHPEIAIEYVQDVPYQPETYLEHLRTSGTDIYSHELNSDFVHLRDRKYLADLSSSEILMNIVEKIAPNLTAEILQNESLYALPVGLEATMWGYHPEQFEQAEVPLDAVPTSYEELLEFISTWRNDDLIDNEDMLLFEESYDLYADIFMSILNAQMLACIEQDIPITFNTPTMRKLLSRLEELKPIIYEVAPKNLSEEAQPEGIALFTTYYEATPPLSRRVYPLQLRLDDQTAPVIQTNLSILFVNPYSEHMNSAMELLEYISLHMDNALMTALMPDLNDPIENSYYATSVAYALEQVRLAEITLNELSDNERTEGAEVLKLANDNLFAIESNRWAMTTEEIHWYHENITPYYTCMTTDFSSISGSNQISNLRQRFIDGQLNADGFIREIESVVNMMQLENQ